jgi:hypothetical protein
LKQQLGGLDYVVLDLFLQDVGVVGDYRGLVLIFSLDLFIALGAVGCLQSSVRISCDSSQIWM